jgi:hypothetical protein
MVLGFAQSSRRGAADTIIVAVGREARYKLALDRPVGEEEVSPK